jgi:hypothetical protein
MVRSFGGITTEDHWVRLAKQGLADLEGREPTAGHRWDSTRQALERARRLRDHGKRKEAERIWAGIEHLYQGDPSAREILEEVKKDRGQ